MYIDIFTRFDSIYIPDIIYIYVYIYVYIFIYEGMYYKGIYPK